MRIRPISISLSPNTEKDDIKLARDLLFKPGAWKKGNFVNELEQDFRKYLGINNAISFNSGRSSLLAILKSLDLKEGDEVLLQAFTCNAVPNPVIWAGLKPVYVDCEEKTFNMDVKDLTKKISTRSRAVIIQHTFGLPDFMDEILDICRLYNLILIEDCAHALGAEYKGKKVGTFGKISFFSFSRDKIISSVYGGMVATNDDNLAQKIRDFQEKIGYPSNFWILQQLLHPVLMNYLILPTYGFFGKYLLIIFQSLHIFSKAVHWKEKRGEKPDYFPKKLPNALAELVLNQFKKIERFSNHRKEIAGLYYGSLVNTDFYLHPRLEDVKQTYLRFVVKSSDAHNIIRKAWNNNILIGDWYTTPVAPHDTRLDKLQYEIGSCPCAEKLAKITFNLPTHINISPADAETIIEFLKSNKPHISLPK